MPPTPLEIDRTGVNKIFPRFIIAAMCLLLLLTAIASAFYTPYWIDEFLTVIPLQDHSFSHMIEVCKYPLNTVPPLYFILTWPYARLFGTGELSLRFLSAIYLLGTALIEWRMLSRRYNHLAAATGIVIATMLSFDITVEFQEARFYTQYLFFAAALVASFVTTFDTNTDKKARPWLRSVLLFVFGSSLLFTHTLGLLYIGCLLAIQISWNLFPRLFRCEKASLSSSIENYIGLLLPILLFVALWGKATLDQQLAFHGFTWVPRPNRRDLINQFLPAHRDATVAAIICCLPIAGAVLLWLLKKPAKDPATEPSNSAPFSLQLDPVVATGVALAVLPALLAWMASHVTVSFFVSRYLIAASVGWGIIFSAGLDFAVRQQSSPYLRRSVYLCLFLISPIIFLHFLSLNRKSISHLFTQGFKNDFSNRSTILDEAISNSTNSSGLPIVSSDCYIFLPQTYYDRSANPGYYYVSDKGFVQAAKQKGFMGSTLVVINSIDRGYHWDHIIPADSLLQKFPRFVFVSTPFDDDWVSYKFSHNENYKVTPLPIHTDLNWNRFMAGIHLYLVEKSAPSSGVASVGFVSEQKK